MKSALLLFFSLIISQSSAAVQTDKSSCPESILLEETRPLYVDRESAAYKVVFNKGFDASNLTYVWTVPKGKILTGQGTPAVTFKPELACGFTVTLEIRGLPESCPNTVSESVCIDYGPPARKITEYGKVSSQKENLELDKFAAELKDEPNSIGFITKSFAPNSRKAIVYQNLQRTLERLETQGIDRSQIRFNLQSDKAERTSLFIVPPGAADPESGGEILDAARLAERLKSTKPRRKKKVD